MIVLRPQSQFSWMTVPLNITPSQVLVLGFAFLILAGTFLLTLPISSASGEALNFTDALFTATSAVAVTGLVVVDTGTYFSTFGQVVILFLIQLGGLGIMTMSTFFALLLGKRINLRGRIILQESLNQPSLAGVVRLLRYIVSFTLVMEGTGALLLFLRWYPELGVKKGAYFALFHAVSAFANAGFDIQGNFSSLTAYQGDPLVNLTVMGLIVLGGLGFAVMADLYTWRAGGRLSLHSRIVLKATAVLLLLGTGLILFLEWDNPATLGNLSLGDKILGAMFQAVTPRTAGFNTLPIGGMTNATILLMMVLMYIGASPGSTGGGIKTTTFATLLFGVWAQIKGEDQVVIWERGLPRKLLQKSITIVFLSIALITLATGVLLVSEDAPFHVVLFEVVSAFGTVGLSLGLTPALSSLGRLVLVIVMFTGRVGPLTLALALGQRKEPHNLIKYAEEKVMVG